MSGEIIELPLAPISPTTPESQVIREISKDQDSSNNSTRGSTGRTTSSKSKERPVPIYLRVSARSCHDSCKYGGDHSFETKDRHLMLKKFIKQQYGVKGPGKTVIVEERKKVSLVDPKPSPVSKTQSHSLDKPESIKRETITLTRDLPSPNKPKIIKRENKILTRETPSPGKRKLVKRESMTLTQEAQSPTKEINNTAKLASSSRKVSSPLAKIVGTAKPANSMTKVSPSKKVVVKPAISLKSKPVKAKLSSSPLNSTTGSSSGMNNNSKVGERTARSRIVGTKPLMKPTFSLSPKPSVKRVTTINSRNSDVMTLTTTSNGLNKVRKVEAKQPKAEKLKEKTLYVIELKPERKISADSVNGNRSGQLSHASLSSPPMEKRGSSPSLSLVSSSTQSSQGYESTTSNESESVSDLKETENKKTPKPKHVRTRIPTVHHEHQDSSSKQTFRKGKVLNVQAETNGARKLRFRKGKGLGNNQNEKSEVGKKNFKKRGETGDSIKLESKTPESEKVVLKHQDVQEKDEQVVINNVIEETASKLVETRKSKVKALVGAFETVISLHDTKPSATTSAG